MKKIIGSILLIACCFSAFASVEANQMHISQEEIKEATYGIIDTKALKVLLDSAIPLYLLDARGNKWHDSNIIPGAILASYEYSSEELESIVYDKQALVVIYCYSSTCPLSDRLIQRFFELGYMNILKYPEGLKIWRDAAFYPVEDL
jgi:hypothetical protein